MVRAVARSRLPAAVAVMLPLSSVASAGDGDAVGGGAGEWQWENYDAGDGVVVAHFRWNRKLLRSLSGLRRWNWS
jgi:hypothetical protein